MRAKTTLLGYSLRKGAKLKRWIMRCRNDEEIAVKSDNASSGSGAFLSALLLKRRLDLLRSSPCSLASCSDWTSNALNFLDHAESHREPWMRDIGGALVLQWAGREEEQIVLVMNRMYGGFL